MIMRLGLTVICVVVLTCCTKPETATAGPPAPTVTGDEVLFTPQAPQLAYIKTVPVVANEAQVISLYGRIAWDDDRTVRVWSPVAGRVHEAVAHIGDLVKSGDLLTTIASPDFDQAQADLRSSSASADLAKRSLARAKALLEHGAAAAKDVEATEAAVAVAVSDMNRAAQKVTLFGEPVGAAKLFGLRSPIDGTIVDRAISSGQEIRSDAALANIPQVAIPMFTVSDPTRLWVWIDVPESSIAIVRAGQEFTLVCRGIAGHMFTGRIELMSLSLDPVTRMARARGIIENPDHLLRAEMYTSCRIVVPSVPGTGPHLQVPSTAVFLNGDRTCLFVEMGHGHFFRRVVEVSSDSAGMSTIARGVGIGDLVVADGALLLNDLISGAGGG